MHDDHCACGCGHHDHDHDHPPCPADPAQVTENQAAFLHQLGHSHYLPVARFLLRSSKEAGFSAVSLAPVFLRSAADSMEDVKEAGAFLQKLEDMGMITLDYDMALDGYAYEEYRGSALYAYFEKTVAESAQRPDFLGDTPELELGSMALTEAGEQIAAAHCGHDHGHHH